VKRDQNLGCQSLLLLTRVAFWSFFHAAVDVACAFIAITVLARDLAQIWFPDPRG